MQEDFIKIDTEGNLYYKGAKLTHEKILDFFKDLDIEKVDDKNYLLKWQVGNVIQKINVIPEDTLFVIKDVIKEDSEIKLLLNDGSKEVLDMSTLTFDGNIPYAMVKKGKIKARFNRHAAFKLGEAILL